MEEPIDHESHGETGGTAALELTVVEEADAELLPPIMQSPIHILSAAAAAFQDSGQELLNFKYEPLKQGDKAFRLMRLLPAADFDADIACEVFDSTLTDHPDYEAVSYVWGDPTTKVNIWLHEKVLWVTENLKLALRYLRRTDQPRCLWVDAVCICQENDLEKSSQVPLMKDIYSCCTCDLIWLGEAREDTELAFTTLRRLQSLEVQRKAQTDGEKHFTNELAVSDLNYEQYNALRNMLTLPTLWQRVWVMQEIACCPRADIILGNSSLPWEILSGILDHTVVPDFYHRAWGHQSHEQGVWDLFTKTQIISHQRDVVQGTIPHKKQSLLDILARFRGASSTDPRDKIYGLLGLTSDRPGIKPDYHKSLSEVYAEVVSMAIDRGKDLDIICQSQWPVGATEVRRLDLPSWIPDFSYTEDVNVLFAQRNVFRAGDPRCDTPVDITGNRLAIFTYHLGKLMPLKPVLATEKGDRISHPTDGDQFRTWMPDSLLDGDYTYFNGEDAFEAYWRTIMLDCKAYPVTRLNPADLNMYRGRFVAWRNSTPKYFAWDDFDSHGDPSNTMDRDGQMADSYSSSLPRAVLIRQTFKDWRFATTAGDQFYCMVPKESRGGDLLVVAKGAKVPLVMRPTTDSDDSRGAGFALVGTAYVHGFMDGEAREWVRQGKLEAETIVLI